MIIIWFVKGGRIQLQGWQLHFTQVSHILHLRQEHTNSSIVFLIQNWTGFYIPNQFLNFNRGCKQDAELIRI